MSTYFRFFACALTLLTLVGCGPSAEDNAGAGSGSGSSSTTTGGGGSTSESPNAGTGTGSDDNDGPFKLGDLVPPFEAPPLAEIEAKAEWVDLPVIDSIVLLRDAQAKSAPLTTVAEALKLKNSSPDANEKIKSALGRLPDDDGKVNWDAAIQRYSAADVKSTNPLLASSTIEFDVGGLIGFGLFSFDWEMKPFASKDAVVSWQTSKDRMFDKVVLRDDLTWSDGKPITAHDIEFSFLAIMSSKVPVPAQRSGTDKLKYVKAYDDRTVVFFHKEPLATNAWNVNFAIVPKHVYESSIAQDPTLQDSDRHVQLEEKPVTGGAYVISKRIRDQEIVLTRRDSYYMHNGKQVRDRPYFKDIRFRIMSDPSVAFLALKAGDLDEMELTPELWMTQTTSDDFYAKNTKVYAEEWVEYHFIWNCSLPYFSDKRVRKALAYAFDHKELIEKLRHGIDAPSHGPFNKGSQWSPSPPPPAYQRDREKAEALLEEADWVDHDGDGIRDKEVNGKSVKFEFNVLTSNRPDRIDICNLLKQSLGEIGIEVNVRPIEFTVLQQNMQKHEFQAAFGGWGTGTDPDTTENIFGTNKERNYGLYASAELDRLYEEGRKEFDPEKRRAVYQKIHSILYDDQPYMWLYYKNSYYGFNKSLRGYVFSPRGPFNYGPGFSSIWMPAQ